MPLKIVLHKEVVLSDIWMDRKTFEQEFRHNLSKLAELFEEDIVTLIEEAGGIAGLLISAEWVE